MDRTIDPIDPIDRTITSAGSRLQRRGRRARIPASATRAGLAEVACRGALARGLLTLTADGDG
ncbi:hypothetical protein [Sorangium sp. So ce542]|uniref:hypothetical protein n=1 Tax=Sorangium sp. So ce542 TaxID=3133316 RepID=UPI003F61BEA6